MAYPDTVESRPLASTTLSGNDGNLAHSSYDAAVWATITRIGTALIGARGTYATLALRLTALTSATTKIRTVAGTSSDVAIGPASSPTGSEIGSDTGFVFPADNTIDVHASSGRIARFTNLVAQVYGTFVVSNGTTTAGSAKVFTPGIAETVSGGLFVKWDGTAGELLRATSKRALKENFAPLNGERAVEVIRQLKPTLFDAIDRTADRPGVTVGIAGFVAEDLAEVDEPGLAAVDETDTPIGRNDEAILTFTVTALQNALDRIEALEAR